MTSFCMNFMAAITNIYLAVKQEKLLMAYLLNFFCCPIYYKSTKFWKLAPFLSLYEKNPALLGCSVKSVSYIRKSVILQS
jgi:hypothetical protein